jgi:branched-subunit amino acid ABC-type transport system permease component
VSTYVEFLLLGLGNGGVFAALAMALVVTYRSSGVLNFATGAQALYAAYTFSLLRNGQLLDPIPGLTPTIGIGTDLSFWPALLITLAIQALLGAAAYLLIFRPLRNHRPVAKAVASIGLMGLLTAIVSYQVGSTSEILVNPIFPQSHISFLGVNISVDRLWLAATIIGLGVVLTVLFRFTRFGLATRASAETEVGALVSGLSPLGPVGARHLHPVHRARARRGGGRALPFARVGHHGGVGDRRARVALGVPQRRPSRVPGRRR